MTRMFLGLELPDALAADILPLQAALPLTCRPVPRTNLHITLVFIGSADLARVGDLLGSARANAAFQQASPFSVSLSELSYFQNQKETVFWMGVHDCPQLENLRAGLLVALEPLGLKSDPRDFCPHVTLGRCRGGVSADALTRFVGQPLPAQPLAFSVDHFALYSSETRQEGPVYRVEARYGTMNNEQFCRV